MKNDQNRDGLPDALLEEKRFFELPTDRKDILPDDWNNPDKWKLLDEIPEDKHFGFAVGNQSNYLFIDADHVMDPKTGKMVPWVWEAYRKITRYGNTYSETSKSGTGWHMICDLGDFADNFGRESNGYNQIIIDMDPAKYNLLSREERETIPKIEFFYHVDGRYVYLTGKNKRIIQVAKDEEAAAIFSELLKLREEYHKKHGAVTQKEDPDRFETDEKTKKKVLQCLPYISASSRETWIKVGISLRNCGFPFEVWDEWSKYADQRTGQPCDKYDPEETPKIWRSFKNTRSNWNVGTIFHLAKENGYAFPDSPSGDREDRRSGQNHIKRDPSGPYGPFVPKGQILKNSSFLEFDPFSQVDQDLPEFNLQWLPDNVKEYAADVCEALQVPPGMIGPAILGISSAAISKKYVVRPLPSWEESVNLYTAIIAPPGSRKSPAMKKLTAPIIKYQKKLNDEIMEEIRANIDEKKLLQKKLDKNLTALSKPDIDRGKEKRLRDERKELLKDLAKVGRTTLYRLMVNDSTPQAVVSIMQDNHERIFILDDESTYLSNLVRYSDDSAPAIELTLKSWDGSNILVDRVGRKSERLESPHMSMLTFTQEHAVRAMMKNKHFSGRGLTARILYSMPALITSHSFRSVSLNQDHQSRYNSTIECLLAHEISEEPEEIYIDPEALKLFEAFYNSTEKEKDSLERSDPFRGWISKLCGEVIRIAANLHSLRYPRDPGSEQIRTDTMEAAIEIGKYFQQHASAVFNGRVLSGDPTEDGARYLMNRIIMLHNEKGPDHLTWRNVKRACKGKTGMQTTEECIPFINHLIKHGYIRAGDVETKGRRGTMIYINPELKKI